MRRKSWGAARPERRWAMLFDEEPVRTTKRLLDDMSIQELKERIEALKADIQACEAAIAKKEASRLAADAAFFKT
jgi:uncharacterized small protein (DUF1192 family)